MIEQFNKISFETPVDKVIGQLRALITSGELSPGEVLPSERKLAERLGVGRLTVRDAIRKLEFYGLVKTHPQSGTIIKGKGLMALEGLIIDILDFEEADFESLVATRNLLEIKSAGLAAIRRTEDDMAKIQKALKVHEDKIQSGSAAENEDFLLHFQIAEVSGNSVLKLLMRIITPDILKSFAGRHVNKEERNTNILAEHRQIVKQIVDQNPKEAKNAMRKHLRSNSHLIETKRY